MINNRALVIIFTSIFLAGTTLTACGGAAPTPGPTPTPTPTPTPLETVEEVTTNLVPYLLPLLSVALAFGLAGYFARRARLNAAKRLPPQFEALEKEASGLRDKMNRGEITEDAYRKQLLEKMVQDEDSNWWVVGKEIGSWYRHNGKVWVKDVPPVSQVKTISNVAQKPWVVGVIMIGLHIAIVVDFLVSSALLILSIAKAISGEESSTIDFLYVYMSIIYVAFVLLLFLIARSLWASKRGDWIVIGFALTVAIAAVLAALGDAYAYRFGLSALSLVIGITLTMFLTRKAWSA
jgi:hypothetical protein